eukprot:169685_1
MCEYWMQWNLNTPLGTPARHHFKSANKTNYFICNTIQIIPNNLTSEVFLRLKARIAAIDQKYKETNPLPKKIEKLFHYGYKKRKNKKKKSKKKK